MKYPQLVSPRAVNAISDWLISRLEQLGVEAPQIYARFLLSLLQSSVQINDPIEYSSLETFIASRKGNGKRLHQLPEDTATLRKLTAVQCLQGIVAADEEITTVEGLVDELCAKLKDFEQSSDICNDASEVTAALLLNTQQQQQQQQQKQHQEEKEKSLHKKATESSLFTPTNNNKVRGKEIAEKVQQLKTPKIVVVQKNNQKQQEQQDQQQNIDERRGSIGVGLFKQPLQPQEIETDPKKRYFRAFPALSKDMDEDSFRALRQHAKSLTWPVDRLAKNNNNNNNNNQTINISNLSSNDSTSSSNSQTQVDEQTQQQSQNNNNNNNNNNNKINSSGNETVVVAKNTGTVKRRSRRRRNQAALKNKALQQKAGNTTKNTADTTSGVSGGALGVGGGGMIQNFSTLPRGKRKERYSTPTYWDTDFEGCWEMGRDLIKEFIDKQNQGTNHRNRSTSESAAYQYRNLPDAAEDDSIDLNNSLLAYEDNVDDEHVECYGLSEEDQEDEVTELSMNVLPLIGGPRRLYERDLCLESPQAQEESEADFVQFKAKFNSSVEALWKDEPQQQHPQRQDNQAEQSGDGQVSRAKLKSFWSHYFHEQAGEPEPSMTLNVPKVKEHEMKPAADIGGYMSLTSTVAPMRTTDLTSNNEIVSSTSDYYSMPSSWGGGGVDFDKNKIAMASSTESTTPVGVFLQDSIWSGNTKAASAAADTDESFYYKVWNANKHQVEPSHDGSKIKVEPNQMKYQHHANQLKTNATNINRKWRNNESGNFAPFAISKWSEGINAGPTQALGFDAIDSSTTGSASVSTTSCSSSMYPWPHHWQTPGVIGQFSQNTVMSLTEMYGYDAVDGGMGGSGNTSASSSLTSPAIDHGVVVESGPEVTLPNHDFGGSSAFMEYSRIKSCVRRPPMGMLGQQVRKPLDVAIARRANNNDDNLLTSDTTHFQPIRTYRDGHTFNICSSWDNINYERSASGFLYIGSEKYLEYKRNDNYTVEDDAAAVAIAGVVNTMPLYASSNCDAANDMRQPSSAMMAPYGDELILKFRIKNKCEIACQTEDPREVAAAAAADASTKDRLNALKLTEQHPMCLLFAGGARYGMRATTRNLSNATGTSAHSDALCALNKAIASAAKSRATRRMQNPMTLYAFNTNIAINDNNNNSTILNNNNNKNAEFIENNNNNEDEINWMASSATNNKNTANMYQSFIWPNNENNNNNNADEVDYCLANNNNNVDDMEAHVKSPWSMSAIGKKCQLNEHKKRKRLNNNNTNSCSKNHHHYEDEYTVHENNATKDDIDDKDDDDENENVVHDEDGADDEHTLWGMCAACHSDNKSLSLPANSLLRDELNQEADEIMSELKNMQSLYIGRDSDSDEGGGDEEEISTNSIDTVAKDIDWHNFKHQPQQQQQQEQQEPNKVLQQMNRFLEDWLRPSTFQGEKYDIWNTNKPQVDNNAEQKQYSDGNILLAVDNQNNNNDINIWQSKQPEQQRQQQDGMTANEENNEISNNKTQCHDDIIPKVANDVVVVGTTWKPLELLRQLNVVEAQTQQSKDDTFLSKLRWEHDNLAALWKTATPAPKMLDVQEIPTSPCIEGEIEEVAKIEVKGHRLRVFSENMGYLKYGSVPATTTTPKIGSNRKRRHSESLNYIELVQHKMHEHNDFILSGKHNIEVYKNNFDQYKSKCAMKLFANNDNGPYDTMDTDMANEYDINDNDNDYKDNANDDDVDGHLTHVVVARDRQLTQQLQEQQQQLNYDNESQTIITCKYWATPLLNPSGSSFPLIDANNIVPANHDYNDDEAIDAETAAAAAATTNNIDGNNSTFTSILDKNASILRHVTTAMVARPLTR